MRARIGDMILQSTRRGGPLPDPAAVRRKLGAGLDPAAPDVTVAEWVTGWLDTKGRLKASVRRSYRQHIDHYIVPVLGEIPLARLRAEHVGGLFAEIRLWNAEIERQRAEGRAWVHVDGDVRKVPSVVGDATIHRIFATLRASLNAAVRQRMIAFNPCAGVELPAGQQSAARVWSPDQVGRFLDATAGDRLHAAWRLALLAGLRRGEIAGVRWDDVDLDAGCLAVRRARLEFGGQVITDTPKSATSARDVGLDADTVRALRELHARQTAERLAAGAAYEYGGWVVCDELGRPYRPDLVSARFRQAAKAAGLPVIRLHDARHTHATMGLEAGVPMKVMSARLGHSAVGITQDLYTHVRPAVDGVTASWIAALVAGRTAQ